MISASTALEQSEAIVAGTSWTGAACGAAVAPPAVHAVTWVTSMPETMGCSTTLVNSRFTAPSATSTSKLRTRAVWRPAAASTSSPEIRSEPSARTSNTRWPAAYQCVSAKCRSTRYLAGHGTATS